MDIERSKIYAAKILPYILLAFVFIFRFSCIALDKNEISLFKDSFTPKPEQWWPVTTLAVWLLEAAVMIAAFIVFRTVLRGNPKWAISVVTACAFLTAAVVCLNSLSGVAVFGDKLVTRRLSFQSGVFEEYNYSEISEVKYDCEIDSGRGASTANPSYVLLMNDGRKVNLHDGVDMIQHGASWINGIAVVDAAIRERNIEPESNHDRSQSERQKCLNMLGADKDKEQVSELNSIFGR